MIIEATSSMDCGTKKGMEGVVTSPGTMRNNDCFFSVFLGCYPYPHTEATTTGKSLLKHVVLLLKTLFGHLCHSLSSLQLINCQDGFY